ncbi:MAG TPA: dTDP-4-dehydrorhamnose 3,5-epimerase, partial [Chloroflexi bacterium]|nr:dTDP-4-dehydrorhamnose 3,5-epimerase [Chloroflexota bacterium]
MIHGVEVKELATHTDERGFFREILRASDPIFAEGFAQWSHTVSHT